MNTTWEEKVTLIIAVQGPSGSDLRWNHEFLKRKPKRVTYKDLSCIFYSFRMRAKFARDFPIHSTTSGSMDT